RRRRQEPPPGRGPGPDRCEVQRRCALRRDDARRHRRRLPHPRSPAAYMEKDKAFWRFFSYLNLFVFSMLVLILADNLPVLFIGWEGVGLCSYLLIGFWYEKMPNAAAGKKAFTANRIGYFGLLCGMFLLVYYTGALDWTGIANGAQNLISPTDAAQV